MREFCGNLFEIQTQQILAQEKLWLSSQEGLLSQGRTLLVFDGDVMPIARVEFLVRKFLRVLIHGRKSGLLTLVNQLHKLRFVTDNELHLLVGEALNMLTVTEHIHQSLSLPWGWELSSVSHTSSTADIEAIQNLHLASGLTPLPGAFIRGEDDRSHTIVLRNNYRAIFGCATIQNLAGAGSRYRGKAMVLCVCLHPDIRGCGLSPLLNAAALVYGIQKFHAKQVYEIVETKNIASFRMNERCGLVPSETEGFLFVKYGENCQVNCEVTRNKPILFSSYKIG